MLCPTDCLICATGELVGASLASIHAELLRLADSLRPLLLEGPTGAGKNGAARAVHRCGPRRHGPFVEISCGGIVPTLLESELFGHERGAFTGATERKIGLIESASGGTIVLDEIDALAPHLQPKLLDVFQNRRIRRVGGVREIAVDVRFICTTNRVLEELAGAGLVRTDFLYRVTACRVALPPLCDRRQDLPELVRHLSSRVAPVVPPFAERTLRTMARYGWPGNVRELEHAIEYAITRARATGAGAPEVRPEHLPGMVTERAHPRTAGVATREKIEAEMARADGELARTAAALGWSVKHLYKMMKVHGIATPGERKRETRRMQAARRSR